MMHIPKPVYHIRFAAEDDVNAVIDLRIEAETSLQAAGIEQPTVRTTGEENIRAAVVAGTTYVVTTGAGDIVGSLALDAADPAFWTPDEAAQPALYLYKFMIRGDRRGSGLGDLLLDWACARAQQCGARWLRLDCWKTNTGLHRYYEQRGFRRFGIRNAAGRRSGALFERPADLQLVEMSSLELVDDTQPRMDTSGSYVSTNGSGGAASFDRYDPTGEARSWNQAAEVLAEMMCEPHPGDEAEVDQWNQALEAASRRLEVHASRIRQAQGMYFRVIDGGLSA